MILIRKARPEDIVHIEKLIGGTDRIKDLIEGFMICEADDVICGCGCSLNDGSSCYISCLAVKQGYRNNGYGSAIIKALLNTADISGIKKAYAITNCRELFIKLRFEKLTENVDEVRDKFVKHYGKADSSDIYHVQLENYFSKSCKGTC